MENWTLFPQWQLQGSNNNPTINPTLTLIAMKTNKKPAISPLPHKIHSDSQQGRVSGSDWARLARLLPKTVIWAVRGRDRSWTELEARLRRWRRSQRSKLFGWDNEEISASDARGGGSRTADGDGAIATKRGGERSFADGGRNRNSSTGRLASIDRGSFGCSAEGKIRRRTENYGETIGKQGQRTPVKTKKKNEERDAPRFIYF